MSEIKITDLVAQETIDRIKELDAEIKALLATYTATARELARGLDINIRVAGDIDRVEQLLAQRMNEAQQATTRLNTALAQQGQVVANTTNTISRQLMEQERVNKTQRQTYTEGEKVRELLEKVNGSYDNRVKQLVNTNEALEANKKQQADLKKSLKDGSVSQDEYTARLIELTKQERELKQTKADLTAQMKNEEKEMASVEGSYRNQSQQLELLKKAYKDLTEAERESAMGKELETAIQNLDAHLKDVAADMGEFQRNVGNYAIAGQNGVVATESVVAAMQQEARTTQDLIDQTKILEEAKTMLNQNDANYQTTLDALNTKIEENKRKLSDVSDIMGKEATSVAEAEAQNKRLQEALKRVDISSDGAKERIKELNEKISANTRFIRENTPALQDNQKASEGLAGGMLSLIGINADFGASLRNLGDAKNGSVFDGLSTKAKAFGSTLTGLLANPWVLAFLGIAGVVAGFKWWYDFNKGMIEASRLTQNYTGLVGDAADKVTAHTQAIADHLGKSFDDTIGTVNTLVQQFGVSWEDALGLIEDGIEAGADMNGRLLDNINQFGPALRDAGVEADQFIAILAETRNGIFDERGVSDILKGGTRLRAMTKQVAASLDAVGISSKKMQEDLESGQITMLQAVQQVSAKLKELPENSQEAGQVMKNVFGRTAAEGGTLLIQSIADIEANLDKAKAGMGELGRLNREQLESQKELSEVVASLFKMSGTSFEELTLKAKTYVTQGLTRIIKGCVDIVNWFSNMYNESIRVRQGVGAIVAIFKSLWTVSKALFSMLFEGFNGLGGAMEGIMLIFSGEFEKGWARITSSIEAGIQGIGQSVIDAGKEIWNNFADEFEKAEDSRMLTVQIGYDADLTGVGAREDDGTERKKAQGIAGEEDAKEAAKRAKEAEKQAKEELKRLYALEESKLAVMAEGHDRELAMIRLKFRRKIDEITGNGETENALRLQLAEQCSREISDCELKYQTELSRLNLENRLAAVEKGSKEELTLKLAQLEASRSAELKAARKTGADVALIDAKFNKQRLVMEKEYRDKREEMLLASAARQTDAEQGRLAAEMVALNSKYQQEVKAAKDNAATLAKIEEEYQKKREKTQEEYEKRAIQRQIDMYKELLGYSDLSAEERAAVSQKLAAVEMEMSDMVTGRMKKDADEQAESGRLMAEKLIAGFQKWSGVALDVLNEVTELMSALYDSKIEKLEAEQEANEEAGAAEVERITALVEKKVITEEEGEARKRAAEAATAKKSEELELRKQELKMKQAKWDKANSIAQATISTALAVMNALQTQPFWLGLAMAAIAGAMGAVQIATIAATPIPAYAKGTDRHAGGPAIVGDGGRPEMVLFNGGAWITPDTPTLVDLPAGAVVLPAVPSVYPGPVPAGASPAAVGVTVAGRGYDDVEMRRSVAELARLIRCQTRQQHHDSVISRYDIFKSRL